jgi:hypothetical protein
MDNSFLSSQNIDNIYEYINAEMVQKHNINLDNDSKNKKIVKKLTKTVFDKLKKDFVQSGNIKAIGLNNFNDMVAKKCVPFLLNKTKVQDSTSKVVDKKKQRKYSVKKNLGVKNVDLNIGETNLKFGHDLTPKKLHKKQSGNYQSFINDAHDFDTLVKESNRQINDSFKAYSEKKTVFNSHDSINDSCNNEISNDFIVDRCAIKDDITNSKLDKSAFNDIFSNSRLGDEDIPESNPGEPTSYDNYNQLNVRELLSEVLVNQKDHSSNELDSYDGELYLPNLIREVGEEAPIQPLLYQNTKQGDERINIKHILLDTGDYGESGIATYSSATNGKLDLTTEGTPTAVKNLGTNRWHKFRINLQQTFKIDKLTDIYVKSFTIVGATTNDNCQFFVLNIEELNILKPSNNKFTKDKLVFRNTNTTKSVREHDSNNLVSLNTNSDVVSTVFPHKSYYVATINPSTLYNITIELTNENNLHADSASADNNIFRNADEGTNRFILELEFHPRPKQNDIIFDRTPYGNSLNAELSNT